MERTPIRVYIAHTTSLRKWVAAKVIPDIEGAVKISTGQGETRRDEPFFQCINPFEGRFASYKGSNDEKEIKSNMPWLHPKLIVQHDLRHVFASEAMIVINTSGPSYGTIMESMIFFQHTKGMAPIIYVVQEPYLNHPWLNHFGHSLVVTHEAAIKALRMYFDI